MTFIPRVAKVYWIWDFSLMADGGTYTYSITNISLKMKIPKIGFDVLTLKSSNANSNAKILNHTYDKYSTSFDVKVDSGYETMHLRLEGLVVNTQYTITYKHIIINDAGWNTTDGTLDYGGGILKWSPKQTQKLSDIGSLQSSPSFNMDRKYINTEISHTIRFTASAQDSESTSRYTGAYWAWIFSNIKDGSTATIRIKITNFRAVHTVDGQTYSISYDLDEN